MLSGFISKSVKRIYTSLCEGGTTQTTKCRVIEYNYMCRINHIKNKHK